MLWNSGYFGSQYLNTNRTFSSGDEGHQAGCRRAKAPEFESDEVLRQAPVDNSAIVADELDSSQAGVKQEDSAAQYEPEAENTLPRKSAGMIARLHGLLGN